MVKKFFFVLVLLSCTLLLVNCGGDGDDAGPTTLIIVPDDIFGSWQGTAYFYFDNRQRPDIHLLFTLNDLLDDTTVVGVFYKNSVFQGPVSFWIRSSGRLEGICYSIAENWASTFDAELHNSETGPLVGVMVGLNDSRIYDFRQTGGLTKI